MYKTTLHKIFNKAFDDASWLEVLKSVFGAKLGLLAQPKAILLKSNEKANAAFELGSFTTTDDRIIGLYKIEVKPQVWLERNKVGLRELLRNVYKYDVDGAIIVFTQQNKWRLSFVSEIKVLNDEGEIVEQATEPKRYTYLLGEGEKVRTPSDRLSKLAGKSLALQDILNAFSVEALNEEFYKIIQAYFYELVGGKIGKGKKVTDYGKGILQLPSVPKENRQIYQEFAVRLIGRTVFCWFLKMKKSDAEATLLPESLLSSKAVKQYASYYHTILERLFFQTLNTPMEQRVENLPEGAEKIPFLNGGLFEPGNQDYYKPNKVTGLNENLNTLKIDDQWFVNFFEELEKYNFTIDENSVTDVEVSVDPEMLGRIFENLLAEIDPDSGETARKATGSFYTPREIVDYMATESLVQYLKNKLNDGLGVMSDEFGDVSEALRTLFKIDQPLHPSLKTHHSSLLDALDHVKILDPACGSGAFPMGVLQKIVQALQKLDPEAEWWIERQVNYNTHPAARQAVREKLSHNPEYARKIGIIQNSLYGVDIQPVAAEISKLRCFLTLVVDENINDSMPNRGIEPLPNLEFKFVTADTLIKLPVEQDFGGLFNANDDLAKLEAIRQEYLQSFGEQKNTLKEQFKSIQDKIAAQQIGLGKNIDVNSRAYQLSTWNPFSHEKSDWFDPKWMFGVEKFDVVIGNPPYVSHDKIFNIKYIKKNYDVFEPFADLYCYFIEKGILSLSDDGVLCYITSNSFLRTNYGKPLRNFIVDKTDVTSLIDVEDSQLFGNAVVNTAIVHLTKLRTGSKAKVVNATYDLKSNFNLFIVNNFYNYKQSDFKKDSSWSLLEPKTLTLIDKIYNDCSTLENLGAKIRLGIATGSNEAFLIDEQTEKDLIIKDPKSIDLIKPILRGRDISRYGYKIPDIKILLTKNGIEVTNYPAIYDHLDSFGEKFKKRGAKGQHWTNLRACAFFEDFQEEKIVWIELTDVGRFAICRDEIYLLNSAYFLIPPQGFISEFLVAILNSKTIHFILHSIAESSGTGTARWINNNVKEFPIPKNSNQITFLNIVKQMEALFSIKEEINPHLPNSHIAQLFEEVIDAMVMELYFKEDFEKAGIEFIKYAERDFESIEGKPEAEQMEIIHRTYQKLCEKDNEIRNNLKLMDIKLADIVMPIKAAK